MDILKRLFDMSDEKYVALSSKLTPSVARDLFIGVRAPSIKKLAKEIHSDKKVEEEFLKDLPHKYIEEYLLHIYLINKERDFEKCINNIDNILPYIDNWMTCDAIKPVVLKKHPKEAEAYIKAWVDSKDVYVSRFGIGMLMSYYLDDRFNPKYLDWVSSLRIDDYYHKMMVAWYFATALAKQYEASISYIKERKLEKWTHNKAIQKARESRRISPDVKEELNKLKIII